MRSKPIEPAPGMNEKREINWGFENLAETHRAPPRGWQRFAIHAALFVTAGLSTMLVPLVWSGRWETEGLFVAESAPVATQRSSQDAANSPDSAIKHQLAAEQERQRGEVLAHQLASAREDLGTLTARVTALTDARTEAEKALQTAQASVAEQKLALEQERQRGDTLLRDLASAREEIEARKVATDAADASAKNAQASIIKQTQAAEQERQRGEVLAHQLASAQVDVATLTARVTVLTDERAEAEKALQTAQASAAEQKLALEQERHRGDTSRRTERQEVEARTSANAAGASAKNPPASATKKRQRGEVLARQPASAREDLGTLTARVTALTDARSEAEKALQAAQASAAEQKLALEQERQRGDTLLRELASAREEIEARKAAANAADASAKNAQASALSRRRPPSKSAQRGESSCPSAGIGSRGSRNFDGSRYSPD